MRRSVSVLATILVLSGAVACTNVPFLPSQPTAVPTPQKPGVVVPAPKPVTVAPVTQTQLGATMDFSGTLESSSSVNLAPQVSGRLERLDVDVGSEVKAGDTIATLQQESFRIAVQQAEANQAAAQARLDATLAGGRAESVASAQAALDAAQTRLAQLRDPSPADVQAAQAAVDTARANLATAQARLEQTAAGATEADLATARSAVDTAQAGLLAAQARLDAVRTPFTQADWAAALAAADTARANLQASQARLDQVKIGALPAELAAQQAAVSAAYSSMIRAQDQLEQWRDGDTLTTGGTSNTQVLQNAQAAIDAYNAAVARLQQLSAGPLPADLQTAISAVETASAAFESASARVTQMKLGALATDVAQAQSGLDTATANLSAAQAKYDQLSAGPLAADLVAAQSGADTATASLASAETRLAQLLNPTDYDIRLAVDAIRQAEQNVALQRNPYTPQDVDAARAAVDQARAAVESARFQLDQTTLVAPFDGIVTQKLVSQGALVSPSTPIVSLSSADLVVLISVEEARLSFIQPGLDATLAVVAYPGQIFRARITSIYPTADPRSRTFIVKLVPEDPARRLRAGMFATVVITGASRASALVVPESAVIQVNGRDSVFVVLNDRAQLRAVTRGASAGGNVEILGGVNPGEQVVVTGNSGLNDGDSVRVQSGTP